MHDFQAPARQAAAGSMVAQGKPTLGASIEGAVSRVEAACHAVETIGDQIVGPRPEPAQYPSGGDPRPISSLASRISDLHDALGRLERGIERIHEGL